MWKFKVYETLTIHLKKIILIYWLNIYMLVLPYKWSFLKAEKQENVFFLDLKKKSISYSQHVI